MTTWPPGMPIDENTPRDRPILAYCDHDAGMSSETNPEMTLYEAHGEGTSYAPTGYHIVVWGGSFDDSTWEYPDQASLPDWWFTEHSEFECAANPIIWWELPPK